MRKPEPDSILNKNVFTTQQLEQEQKSEHDTWQKINIDMIAQELEKIEDRIIFLKQEIAQLKTESKYELDKDIENNDIKIVEEHINNMISNIPTEELVPENLNNNTSELREKSIEIEEKEIDKLSEDSNDQFVKQRENEKLHETIFNHIILPSIKILSIILIIARFYYD